MAARSMFRASSDVRCEAFPKLSSLPDGTAGAMFGHAFANMSFVGERDNGCVCSQAKE